MHIKITREQLVYSFSKPFVHIAATFHDVKVANEKI